MESRRWSIAPHGDFHGIFLGSSHTSDLKIGIPVATVPGSALGLVRPGIGML